MKNNIPCRICGQPNYGVFHSLQDQIERRTELADYHHMRNEDALWYRERKQVEILKHEAHRRGMDGHSYQPISNLEYLEYKYEQTISNNR